jgi:hypothetical protein
MPLGALAGSQSDHAGVHIAPLLAEGVAEVELVLDGDEGLGRRRVGLDGLDLGRKAFDLYAVMRSRVGNGHRHHATAALQMAEVVVEELAAERLAIGCLKVIGRTGDGHDFAGGEDVVVIVHFGEGAAGDVQANLFAVSAGQVEVRVPGDGYRFGLAADVVGNDRGVDAVRRQCDLDDQVGFGEPVSVKVAAMDDTGDTAAVCRLLHLQVFDLGLQDQAVHGVALCLRLGADVVGGQGDGVALPFGGEGFAVCGELAADAVGIGEQESRAQAVAEIAVGCVVLIEHLGGVFQAGRGQYVHCAFAGEECGDLLDLKPTAWEQGDGGELRLGGARCGLARNGDGLHSVHFWSGGLLGLGHSAKYTGGDGQYCECDCKSG